MHHEPFTIATAFILGLMHSLEPSHAKAILASYFLDRKRTITEAMAFALTVTIAHTLTIFLLALAGYFLLPQLLHAAAHAGHDHDHSPLEAWTSLIGGILMLGIGLWMFYNERQARFHREESCCSHDHPHGHFFHHHHYQHDHPTPSSLRQIFILGWCSGAIPCMSGLSVLISALSTAQPLHGMLLVGVFSLGLGVVVLAMCLLMQQAPRWMERYWQKSRNWTRFLPVISSILIFVFGLWIVYSSIRELQHP